MKQICICLIAIFILLFAGLYNNNSDKRTVIKFSSWGSKSETAVLKQLLTEFERNNPNLKIDFIHIPQNYFQKLQLLFASGLEPDVVFINNQNIQMYINAGLLENLNPYFEELNENFYQSVLNCFNVENKIYAIPRDISNLVIYYNKDIFNKRDVKMPSKIKDIFELKDIAKKVTSKENWGINFESSPLYWGYYLASNGGGIISDDKKKIIINQPKSIEALNLYLSMLNIDKSMPQKADIGSMTTAQMFINGKLAMYISGRWMTPKFREMITFNWDVVEFPAPNKVYIDSSGYAISKNSKHKKESVLLIKYLTSTSSISKIADTGLIIPANKSVAFKNNNQLPANSNAFIGMLKMSKPTPVNENYSVIMDIVTEKIEQIFSNKMNIDKNIFDENTINQLESYL